MEDKEKKEENFKNLLKKGIYISPLRIIISHLMEKITFRVQHQ